MTAAPSEAAPPPEVKIGILNSSVRCFALSLAGLIPLLGLPFSVAALLQKRALATKATRAWNPAGRYVRAAGWLAPLGFLSSAGFVVALCVLSQASEAGFFGGGSGSS
jgi:hypothetical protein